MRNALIATVLSALLAAPLAAAPGLEITKPPVGPVPSWTGPVQDPHAEQGQWFMDLQTGSEEVRPLEFHDNVVDFGGGWASSNAIYGIIKNVVIGGSGNLTGFTIEATIVNDCPGSGPWRPGSNSHDEFSSAVRPWFETMYHTKLSVEFAVDAAALLSWQDDGGTLTDPPYRDSAPYIEAVNHDELAWYCWTPNNGEGLTPEGDYLVPTWDFGDIALGQPATRDLDFATNIAQSDPRFEFIVELEGLDQDVLLNRTTSLKISTWIDELAIDPGTPYPLDDLAIDFPLRNSDVSVFFDPVPEPASLSVLLLGATALLRRRRKVG